MAATPETVSQVPEPEKQAAIRVQIRQQIGMLVAQSAQRPAHIQRLKAQLEQPNVIAAFGAEYADVKAAVDTL